MAHVAVFARIKPGPAPNALISGDASQLQLTLPKDEALGTVNNTREQYVFAFSHVFDARATQESVFDHVARPVADR
jgi:hypothetical protein